MEERLQKILSAAGICSRRSAEDYMAVGRVLVNGNRARIGEKADPDRDDIRVDGVPLQKKSAPIYIMLYKPRGYVTTLSDEKGRKNVAALVKDCGTRIWPVGRLDLDSEGLLLMTNDGEVTNLLLHPRHEVEKEYWVTVSGDIAAGLPILRGPLVLDGVKLSAAKVEDLGDHILSITIHEGKNRQVRRMCEAAELSVHSLCRVREGKLKIGNLRPGKWRLLGQDEIKWLKSL